MDFSIGWCLLFELECIAACYSMVDQLTKGGKVKKKKKKVNYR